MKPLQDLKHVVQVHGSAKADTIEARLVELIRNMQCSKARVAMAYVTIAGARVVIDALEEVSETSKSEWLVGLDDLVTQPGALDLLTQLPGATVRIASLASRGARFHTKFCAFESRAHKEKFFAVIGSANLTKSALSSNAENVTILSWPTPATREALERLWGQLWEQGHSPTEAELKAYASKYAKAKRLWKKIVQLERPAPKKAKARVVLDDDLGEIDPSLAAISWIECGKPTAQGRELELKAEQGLFFGLNLNEADSTTRGFLLSDGSTVPLRIKYQAGNGMWRLQLKVSVPEVAIGLRPRLPDGTLGRSPFVALFERLSNRRFRLRFVRDTSREYSRLKKRTKENGTMGSTLTRAYGWC